MSCDGQVQEFLKTLLRGADQLPKKCCKMPLMLQVAADRKDCHHKGNMVLPCGLEGIIAMVIYGIDKC